MQILLQISTRGSHQVMKRCLSPSPAWIGECLRHCWGSSCGLDGFPDGWTMWDHPDRPPGLLTRDGLPGRLLSQQPQQRVWGRGRGWPGLKRAPRTSPWMNGHPRLAALSGRAGTRRPCPPASLYFCCLSAEFVQGQRSLRSSGRGEGGEQHVLVSMCKAGHGGARGERGSQGFRCPHLEGAKLVIS